MSARRRRRRTRDGVVAMIFRGAPIIGIVSDRRKQPYHAQATSPRASARQTLRAAPYGSTSSSISRRPMPFSIMANNVKRRYRHRPYASFGRYDRLGACRLLLFIPNDRDASFSGAWRQPAAMPHIRIVDANSFVDHRPIATMMRYFRHRADGEPLAASIIATRG